MGTQSRTAARAAMAGVAAGGLALGVGELLAVPVGDSSAPFLALGGAFVDLTPEWLKSFAIRTFGENDKTALLLGMAGVLLGGAVTAGIAELRRAPWGSVLLGGAGALAAVAAATRPGAGVVSVLPSVVGVIAGIVALGVLAGILRSPTKQCPTPTDDDTSMPLSGRDRRRFLVLTIAAASLGVVGAWTGQRFGRATENIRAARDRLLLPMATTPAPSVPNDVEVGIDGVAPFRTPNAEFYRVDTALSVPAVSPDEWRLRVHGMVDEPFELSFDDVLGLELVERMITLTCVSNEVGGELAGNATWLGYPLRDLLGRAGPATDADMVLSTSADGFTAGTPLTALTDERDALLAVGMNGEPLPLEHGFPARLVVPGLYGYVSATKWVVDLEVTRFDRATAYWTDRGWAVEGPIKTASRIDVPGSFAELSAGPVRVAGVAWAQQRGISAIEVRVDDRPWAEADLAAEASIDTWRQWAWTWDAEPGRHTLSVRARDGTGELQTNEQAPPIPDGSSGWHSVAVEVS